MNYIKLGYQFNNYLNRRFKIDDDNSSFIEYPTLVNFISGDGLYTTQVLNIDTDKRPDYLLVLDENKKVMSRWFVLGSKKLRENQFSLNLKRDVLVDYHIAWSNSIMQLQRGMLNDETSPLIFNDENILVNKIKQAEIMIKDDTDMAWVIGYCDPKYKFKNYDYAVDDKPTNNKIVIDNQEVTLSVGDTFMWTSDSSFKIYVCTEATSSTFEWARTSEEYKDEKSISFSYVANTETPDITVDKIENWQWYKYVFGVNNFTGYVYDDTNSLGNVKIVFNYQKEFGNYKDKRTRLSVDSYIDNSSEWDTDNSLGIYYKKIYGGRISCYRMTNYWNHVQEVITSSSSLVKDVLKVNNITTTNENKLTELKALDNLIIYDKGSNSYYKIKFNIGTETYKVKLNGDNDLCANVNQIIYDTLTNAAKKSGYYPTKVLTKNATFAWIYLSGQPFYLTLENVTKTGRMTITDNHFQTSDALYNIFAIPYPISSKSSKKKYIDVNGVKYEINADTAIKAAQAIYTQLGGRCYDIQLLPFMPDANSILTGDNIKIRSGDNAIYGQESTNPISCLYWCRQSTFSGSVEIELKDTITQYSSDPVSLKKADTICETYRLVSPNYASVFEFSPYKLDSTFNSITNTTISIDYDCTYKPYNPYIHVQPRVDNAFIFLYGRDFDDSFGLTFSGDFSLTQVSDAWTNYELNNKNYQNIFDREIKSLDLSNTMNAVSSVFGATANAAIAGMLTGGVGAVASGIGGVADVATNLVSMADNKSKTLTQNAYQLGNVKALPQSLTKITSFTANYKYFPFIERYNCTSTERDVVENLIKYRGMNINSIVDMSNWTFNEGDFLQGSIIQMDLEADSNIYKEINDELSRGIYLDYIERGDE